MDLMKNNINRTKGLRGVVFALLPLLLTCVLLFACSVSYKFNGASIDYTKTKTIQINDFPNSLNLCVGTNGVYL